MSNYHPRPLLPAPDRLIARGKYNLGTFDAAIKELNMLDANKPFGLPLPSLINDSRLKEWQAHQLGNEKYFILAVLYDTKTVAVVQFVLYDKQSKKLYKYEKMLPTWSIKLPKGLHRSSAEYDQDGFRLSFDNNLEAGSLTIDVDIKNFDELPDVEGQFIGHHAGGAPMVVCMPFDDRAAMYSHKCLMPMRGEMSFAGEKESFKKEESFLIIDDHKAYYPYELKYDWVTGVGRVGKSLIGFNFTDNQVSDQERYNENCIWYDDQLHLMPPVKFERPEGVHNPWLVRDSFGLVDLAFTPEVKNEKLFDFGVIKSDYYGPYGSFTGEIKTPVGKVIKLDGFFGMGEQKLIRG